jgi:deoxyguanosine kinase
MLIISIEGNIGSGKSTLINKLKKEFTSVGMTPVIYIDEPVKIWNTIMDNNGDNIIKKYYEDQKKYAFQFQMMAYITRITELRKAMEKYNGNCIIITERSIETDKEVFAKMLYEKKILDNISYTIYLKWFEELSRDLKVNELIYLKTDPETALKRVIKRNRPGETIPIDYLNDCHERHERWLHKCDDVLLLNGERDIDESFNDKLLVIKTAVGQWNKQLV